MRVDVVAAPVRYRRAPLLILLVVAVLPAVGLFIAHRWLADEANRYDDSRDEVDLVTSGDTPGTSADDAPTTAPTTDAADDGTDSRGDSVEVLATSLFDYRRLPQPVADLANANQLGATVAPLFGFLNERSCAAVSVDGVAAAAHNPEIAVIPASVQKLVVAAVALHVLGDDYTFETTVRAPVANDGVVEGDVYLVGGGDPLLTSDDFPIEDDRYPAFNTTSLDLLADAFVANGIERITGTVIGDGTRYDDEFVIEAWGDGVAFEDAGPYDALLVNDARVLGRDGRERDPNVAAARELARLLGNRNVRVNNGWGSGIASTTTEVIGSVRSAPLADIVHEMLLTSDNNTAEMLVKELGIIDSLQGTRAAGLTVIDRTMREWGIDMSGVRVLDGSGLDPSNEMSCGALLAVLQRSQGTAVATGLPVAAQTGTLTAEFENSVMAGRIFAKTGTLGNPPTDEPPPASKALAGYASADNDDTIEFVLIINDDEITTEAYRALWAAFADRFATYPEGPAPDDVGPR